MYIPVSHTNGRSINNMIGVVMNHLVGMGLYVTWERKSEADFSIGSGRSKQAGTINVNVHIKVPEITGTWLSDH